MIRDRRHYFFCLLVSLVLVVSLYVLFEQYYITLPKVEWNSFSYRSRSEKEFTRSDVADTINHNGSLPTNHPLPNPAPAPAVNVVLKDWVTRQKCHTLADESEFCEYEGPMCLAKDKVFVSTVAGSQERDDRFFCMDFRYFERAEHCAYGGPFTRENTPIERIMERIQDKELPIMNVGKRYWGPDLRLMHVTDIPRSILIEVSLSPSSRMPSTPELEEWFDSAKKLKGDSPAVELPEPGELLKTGTDKAGVARMPHTIKWLDGAMYVSYLLPAWEQHLWHFSSATFQLFAIKRENITDPSDESTHYAPRGNMHLPPMDYVALPGTYWPLNDTKGFAPWIQTVLPFLTQSHTKIITNGMMEHDPEYRSTETEWLCSMRGVVTGIKPRFFTGVGDAHAFRAAAYSMVNITKPAWSHHPPKKITIVNRTSGRRFWNVAELVELVNSTGLPYEVVENLMDGPEQIRLMSETGIFISTHGNAATNAIYLPAHSVFVEVYPHMWYNTAFKNLGQSSDLYHINVHSSMPPEGALDDDRVREAFSAMLSEEFKEKCENKHWSSADTNLISPCNGLIKNSPVWLPMDKMKLALTDALDIIGCRDGVCT